MNIVPWKTKREEATPSLFRSEIDRVFDRMLSDRFFSDWGNPFRALTSQSEHTFAPKIDVSETEKELVVTAEVPGVDPNQIDVTLADGVLTLRGEKRDEKTEEKEGYYHAERSFGSFQRSIQLPTTANLDRVNAEYKNGLLEIRIEKLQGAGPKKVTIATAK